MYQDILLTLLGFPSDFIISSPSSNSNSQSKSKQPPQPTYRVKEGYPNLLDSDREQIDKIVPLGWYYNQFQTFTDHHELSWGNTNRDTQVYKLALSGAVKDLLHEYVDDVTGLEDVVNNNDLVPLSHFIHHLQKYLIVFPQLFAMLYHIEETDLRGCQIVDYFTKYACGVQVLTDLINRIIARLRVPLLKQIFAWMVFGTLQDDSKEFFIQMRNDQDASEYGNMTLSKEQRLLMRLAEAQEESAKASNPHHRNDRSTDAPFDWYSTYSLRIENIPDSHISPAIASKVMFAGKAAKLLQSSSLNNIGVSKEMKENEAFLYLSRGSDIYTDNNEDTKDENDKKPTSASSLLSGDMPYTREEIEQFDEVFKFVFLDSDRAVERLEKAIDLVCHSVSTRLWTLLKDHLGFYEYLHIIRNTYLMGKGELMQCVIDDLHVLTQQSTPALEVVDDTLNWRVLRNAGKLVGLQDEDDIHRMLQLKVQSHILTVEKFHTDDHRFLTMAGIAQHVYPTSTSVPEEEKRRYIFNPTGILLCVPKAQSLADHYALLWRERHIVHLHQHRQHYRSVVDAEEEVEETGNPWRFSRHYRGPSSQKRKKQQQASPSSLVYETRDDRDAYLVRRVQALLTSSPTDGADSTGLNGTGFESSTQDRASGSNSSNSNTNDAKLPLLSYANAAVWFTDPKFVSKGFDVSVTFRPAWHVARSISAEHRVFHSQTARMSALWPQFPELYPFPRCQDIVLGSTSVCVHSDGRGISAVGQGELNRHIQHSLLIGVSFHACVFDTSSALDGEHTIHAHQKKSHVPLSAPHGSKSGVKYYARMFVARGGNDGMLRLPLNKRLQVNIGDGYYRAPDPHNANMVAEDYILAEKVIDLDKNLGYLPDSRIRSLSTLSSRMHLDVSYQRVMQYQAPSSSATVASATSHALNKNSNNNNSSSNSNGVSNNANDIFQGLRERGVHHNSAAAAAPTTAGFGRSSLSVGGGSVAGSTVHMVGEVAHRMRLRLRPDEDFEEDENDDDHHQQYRSSNNNNNNNATSNGAGDAWDIDIPLDLSVFVKNTSGQVWIGTVSSGLLLQEQSSKATQYSDDDDDTDDGSDSDEDPAADDKEATNNQRHQQHDGPQDEEEEDDDDAVQDALQRRQRQVFHCILSRLHFEGKGSLYSYPVCSPFTSARYPDSFLQLEREVSKIRAWMHLKMHVHFPAIFTVIFDADSKRNYERVFSLVMKVRLVARLLEKLWMARSKWITDRLYCNLRHAMHFFISNLLYYLQVDVVDSEYATFQNELRHLTEFQAVLMAHRHFLANILRLSMLDNQAIQECFDRLLHLCLRFVAACRIQARSEAAYVGNPHSGHVGESILEETAMHLPPHHQQQQALQTPMLNRSKLSLSPTPASGGGAGATPQQTNTFQTPVYIPMEEFEIIRKEFFQQIAYLLQFMKKVESRGFLFRLDFNGFLSQHSMDLGHHA